VFETFVASEIVKRQISLGRSKELYYFRDQQGLEVDFVLPRGDRRLLLIEAKATKTMTPRMAEPLVRLSNVIHGYDTESIVVHRPSRGGTGISTLRPGVKALPLDELLAKMGE
jgi:hypothetical protein